MLTPLVLMAAAGLHCAAIADGSSAVVRHHLSFPVAGRMVDTMSTGLGVVRTSYTITESDRSGFNAVTRLAPDAIGVMTVDYTGQFQQMVQVNGTMRMATGVCR